MVAFLTAACGPSVTIDGDAEGSTSTSGSTSDPRPDPPAPTTASGPNPTTVTTSPPDPTTGSPPDDTTSGDDSSGVDDTGISFLLPTGGGCDDLPEGTMAHCSRCDVWSQDCADGEACKPWANDGSDEWNATRCSPIDARPAAVGEPCMAEGSGVSGIDSCEEGSVCWNVGPETLIGRCIEFCGGNEAKPMCGDPDTTCVIANDGVLPLCLPTCDPLAQDCADGEACYPNATFDAFVCLPPGAAHTTGNELFHTACPSGSFAVDPDEDPQCDDAPCCVPFCDMYDEETCAPGTACESLTPDCGFFLCDQVGACRPTEP